MSTEESRKFINVVISDKVHIGVNRFRGETWYHIHQTQKDKKVSLKSAELHALILKQDELKKAGFDLFSNEKRSPNSSKESEGVEKNGKPPGKQRKKPSPILDRVGNVLASPHPIRKNFSRKAMMEKRIHLPTLQSIMVGGIENVPYFPAYKARLFALERALKSHVRVIRRCELSMDYGS